MGKILEDVADEIPGSIFVAVSFAGVTFKKVTEHMGIRNDLNAFHAVQPFVALLKGIREVVATDCLARLSRIPS